MRLATAIAATIDAPSCMAPQVTPSTAHPAVSAQIDSASLASTFGSAVSSLTTAAVVPHCAPSTHPMSGLVESHVSPIAALPTVASVVLSPSAVLSAAAHVFVPSFPAPAITVAVKSVAHVTHEVPTFGNSAVPISPRQVAQFKAGSQVHSATSSTVAAVV
jgi:hypothetical protein